MGQADWLLIQNSIVYRYSAPQCDRIMDPTRRRKIDARVRWLLFGEEEEENLLFS